MKISEFKKEYCIQIDDKEKLEKVRQYLIKNDMEHVKQYITQRPCSETNFPYFIYFGEEDSIIYPVITNSKPPELSRKTLLFEDVELE